MNPGLQRQGSITSKDRDFSLRQCSDLFWEQGDPPRDKAAGEWSWPLSSI
jgi:hypothetical protein